MAGRTEDSPLANAKRGEYEVRAGRSGVSIDVEPPTTTGRSGSNGPVEESTTKTPLIDESQSLVALGEEFTNPDIGMKNEEYMARGLALGYTEDELIDYADTKLGFSGELNRETLRKAAANPEGDSHGDAIKAIKAITPEPVETETETETEAEKEPEIKEAQLSNMVDDSKEVTDNLLFDLENKITDEYGSLDNAMSRMDTAYNYVEDLESAAEQVKTISQMYRDGDFGEVGSKDAKDRRAMFVMSEISKALGIVSGNLLGKDTKSLSSMADEVNTTNLQQALERHNKTKEEKRQTMSNRIESIEGLSADMKRALQEMNIKYGGEAIGIFRDETAMLRLVEIENKLGDYYSKLTPDQVINLAMAKTADGDAQDAIALTAIKAIDDPELTKKITDMVGTAVGGAASAVSGTLLDSFVEYFGL